MISAVECREHAVECRQMSERAPSPRVRDILIDMARSWERLALETEHNAPTSAKLVLRHSAIGLQQVYLDSVDNLRLGDARPPLVPQGLFEGSAVLVRIARLQFL
jgi:hypothetical protein